MVQEKEAKTGKGIIYLLIDIKKGFNRLMIECYLISKQATNPKRTFKEQKDSVIKESIPKFGIRLDFEIAAKIT
ncbi:1971_t:CDS:2 [Entrophospora sp. SA101]|nr:1971_t:CDS:2 [Entrophospora sp. SA101]